MGFLDSIFGKPQPKRTLLDDVQDAGGKLVVGGYRRIAAQRGCAPTAKTSDAKIIEIYARVGTAFRDVANERGEPFPAAIHNNIVLFFLQLSETMGDAMMESHLAYELDKFRSHGLRSDYKQPLNLFGSSGF